MNGTPQQPFVRRNIWSLDPNRAFESEVTLNYAKAVAVMRRKPATDPTSWAYQAGVHGAYSAVPAGASWNQCQHATWYFLPWHRMYLHFFEKIVRAAIEEAGEDPSGWALPYWNYSDGAQPPSNTLPRALRARRLPDDSANPLFVPYPNRNNGRGSVPLDKGINDGGQLPRRYLTYSQALNFTNFTFPPGPSPGFGGPRTGFHHEGGADSSPFGELENQPHNIVHVLVGGDLGNSCRGGWMTDPNCAAQEPVFWLHHSNIDRLWNRWGALPGHLDPTQTAWLDKSFKFYDPETEKIRSIKVRDVVNSAAQLGYRYDDDPPPVARAPRRARPVRDEVAMTDEPAAPRPIELGSTGPVTFSDRASSAQGKLAVKTDDIARMADAADPTEAKDINLFLEQVDRDDDAGLLYDVYLNLPDDQPPDPEGPYFVGSVAFFGHKPPAAHDEGSEHSHPGMAFSFRVTNLVNEQKELGVWKDGDFNITLVAGGHRPEGSPSVRDVGERDVAGGRLGTVRVGKVALIAQ
jgi:hypothetical protein